MYLDLHSHSTASDGSLSVAELLERASNRNVELMSITDHDTVAAYRNLPASSNIKIIPGLELSCTWARSCAHILGFNVDIDSPALTTLLQRQSDARGERAERIAKRLAKKGMTDLMPAVRERAKGRAIGRPDFAKELAKQGYVADPAEAFQRWLGTGKIGDVSTEWVGLEEGVQTIVAAGGVACIAHPKQYKLTNTKLRRLITEFKAAGGKGLEVYNGRPQTAELSYLRGLCREYELLASIGSDFHTPTEWLDDGCDSIHTGACKPIWERWSDVSSPA